MAAGGSRHLPAMPRAAGHNHSAGCTLRLLRKQPPRGNCSTSSAAAAVGAAVLCRCRGLAGCRHSAGTGPPALYRQLFRV